MSDLHIVEDTTPQLGGDLDLNGHSIAGASAAEIGYLSGVTSPVQTQLDATEKTVNKNQPNGYPGLDANGNLVGTIIPRSGTAAEIDQIVLLAGEVAYCTDMGHLHFICRNSLFTKTYGHAAVLIGYHIGYRNVV
jgi:hypothetical protein